ncbi:hypothetical protein CN980_29550 [Bacillus cereus]|uniref:Uncharacterized protein n=1 Tax=Bacillus cereus TaxID=1396 RepID=A0A9X7C5Z4_BACCE|nr:hypothetical protein [Bacillus cereus]OUB12204.1 hypothetical protein BK708_28380 [Bacillus thuringiensis serovar yunnanensis]PGO61501.1 hypothetical protein CN980_29550 [Bacillus cereus]
MLMKWEFERFASDKQCIERALAMWKEWMNKKKKTYTDELAAEGTMYVVNHMKLRDHQVSVIHDFFDEYLTLLDHGEEQAEAFYKTIMRM